MATYTPEQEAAAKKQLEKEAANMAQFGAPTPELARPQGKVTASPSAPAGFGVDETGRAIKTDVAGKPDPYFERQATTSPEKRQYTDEGGNLVPPPKGVPESPEMPTPPASAAPADTKEQEGKTEAENVYRVSSGDNLTRIARRHGTTVSALLAANPDIKNPNLIYPGQSIRVPGGTGAFRLPDGYEVIDGARYPTSTLQRQNFTDIQTTPDGVSLYGKRIDPVESVNAQQKAAFEALEKGSERADVTKRESVKVEEYLSEIDSLLGTGEKTKGGQDIPSSVVTSDGQTIDLSGDASALTMYRELMRAPEITGLERQISDKQEEIDKVTATELALAEDIRKQVEGEAPQSYIDALVAERMKDLYPRKVALVAEQRNLIAQYNAEKENAANVLQFTLRDNENRYNRLFQMLQFTAQRDQNAFANELAIFNAIKDIPAGRSVTINGKTYEGKSETANLNVVQFTDASGNITVVGIDKQTGEVKYTKVIGKAKVAGSGTAADSSYAKKLSELRAQLDYETLQKIQSGQYKEIRSEEDGSISIIRHGDYVRALESWEESNPPTWYQDDETVSYEGKTYRGAADAMPNIAEYEVFFSK